MESTRWWGVYILGYLRVDTYHFTNHQNTHPILSSSWSHACTSWIWKSMHIGQFFMDACRIRYFHLRPILVKAELGCVTNYHWMVRDVRLSIDDMLTVLKIHHFMVTGPWLLQLQSCNWQRVSLYITEIMIAIPIRLPCCNTLYQYQHSECLGWTYTRIHCPIQAIINVESVMAPVVWYLLERTGGVFKFFTSYRESPRCPQIIFRGSIRVKWLLGLDIISRSMHNIWHPPHTSKPLEVWTGE